MTVHIISPSVQLSNRAGKDDSILFVGSWRNGEPKAMISACLVQRIAAVVVGPSFSRIFDLVTVTRKFEESRG